MNLFTSSSSSIVPEGDELYIIRRLLIFSIGGLKKGIVAENTSIDASTFSKPICHSKPMLFRSSDTSLCSSNIGRTGKATQRNTM